MDGEVLEIAMYRVKPGIDRQRFLEESAPAGGWLQSRPGFLEDAQAAAAQFDDAAATEFATAPELSGLMAAVDPESIAMYHARKVATE